MKRKDYIDHHKNEALIKLEYLKTHTWRETADTFNITQQQLQNLRNKYGETTEA